MEDNTRGRPRPPPVAVGNTMDLKNILNPCNSVYSINQCEPAYTREQRDCIRYMKEDCGMSWESIVENFNLEFHKKRHLGSIQNQYYRDNKVPRQDREGNLVLGTDGKLKFIQVLYRHRIQEWASHIPHTLVERHPDRAVKYTWVKEEDKKKAGVVEGTTEGGESTISVYRKALVTGNFLDKAGWRKLISKAEERELLLRLGFFKELS